jgi:hypothetical protein
MENTILFIIIFSLVFFLGIFFKKLMPGGDDRWPAFMLAGIFGAVLIFFGFIVPILEVLRSRRKKSNSKNC